MNLTQAVIAMEQGKSVEIFLTEQVCTIFTKEGYPFVRLIGPSAKDPEVVETTEMTLDHFKMLYRVRDDIKIVQPPKQDEDSGDSQDRH